ncbi:MAG: hypothetical protein KGL31_12920 [candidate division NC10 bacterium]|nr:hypothetical protein [candidate division NC10 bacterium]MDE2322790.1 hypothetical protein [candidate division NC10 bacterium]
MGANLFAFDEKYGARTISTSIASCMVALIIHAVVLAPDGQVVRASEESLGRLVETMSEHIRDNLGRTIGRFERHPDGEVRVYDALGRPLGHAGRNGTFDQLGRRISPNNVPALLLKCPDHPQ